MAERLSEEYELLAATYALGVVEGDERIEARRRHAEDGAFAAEVHAWQRRLVPLYEEVEAAEPSASVWRGVVATIDSTTARSASSVGWWRAATGVASAIAAGLALMLVFRPPSPVVETPVLVEKPVVIRDTAPAARPVSGQASVTFAQLVDEAGKPLLTARYEPAERRILIANSVEASASRVPELWVIPTGGSPHSLGLITDRNDAALTISPAQSALITKGATLAVTLEDPSTGPHRAPSGNILAQGPIARL